MSKPTVYVLCGLPASGKSAYAKALSEETGAKIFSSDALRAELYGDANNQEHNAELFQELHKRIKDCLKSGKNAIYDATNLSSKRRRSFLQELNKIDCVKICVVMATPFEQCLENNDARDRKVPFEVIDRMYRHWNTPAMFEGWDSIEVVYWEGSKNSRSISHWLYEHINDNQYNPHHTMTIGRHCVAVGNQFKDDSLLMVAGYLHDCGKPYCMKFENSKGEPTDIAHFYGHENVGAYDALFFDCEGERQLDVSLLVNLHMIPYYYEKDGGNERLRNKYKKLWGYELGDDLFEYVTKLHEADKNAH